MKYIIAGKNESSGIVGDDSSHLELYFELGWEVVGSRLDLIRLVNTGKINVNETTIVTVDDRKFMYTSFCKNVISWEEYKRRVETGEVSNNDSIADWTLDRDFLFLNKDRKNIFWENKDSSLQSNSRYFRYIEDYNLIMNGFEKNPTYLDGIGEDEKFYVATLRFRDHCAHRSSPQEWWKQLLNEISNAKGRKIFLVGHGSENFVLNNNMKYVPRLQDYVTLIQDHRCCGVIASSTGTALLAYSASKSPVHLIDHIGVSAGFDCKVNNAVMGGVCSQFLKSHVFKYGPSDITSAGIQRVLLNLW